MQFQELGCHVEEVDSVFDTDPAPLWTAEFYASVGIRLRNFIENQRDLLDPAVADVLEPALAQEMRAYYTRVFERYALREKMRLFFERFDVLLSPVLPVTSLDARVNIPPHLGYRNLVSWVYYTYPFNLTGQPGASVCAGTSSDGMPAGAPDHRRCVPRGRGGARGCGLRANTAPGLQRPALLTAALARDRKPPGSTGSAARRTPYAGQRREALPPHRNILRAARAHVGPRQACRKGNL
jgi:hypothetical protein